MKRKLLIELKHFERNSNKNEQIFLSIWIETREFRRDQNNANFMIHLLNFVDSSALICMKEYLNESK